VIFTASQSRYASNIDTFDRDVFRVEANVSLNGKMF
jgi:hypothetical protein